MARTAFFEALEEVSEAVESGAGLPAVARAAGRALEASVIVLDSASSVLAVACASSEDERAVMAGERGTETVELRVADERVGELRFRSRAEEPLPTLLRLVANLIALELERAKAPARASGAAVGDFLSDLLARTVTDRENIAARAAELGCDLRTGATVIVVRARPPGPEDGDWRARVLTLAERGARGVERGSLAATVEAGLRADPELVVVAPGADPAAAARVAVAILRELEAGQPGFALTVARSRHTADPADLHRAGAEALLAANVAEARSLRELSFEETGAYRLLLPAMSEDPAELERFYEETVAPLVAYDDQYETELVRTLETYLDADANVAGTAEKLFTHRHTIRYRLERVKELTGLDVSSTDGRERLSLGLKAMRVLGMMLPGGPASEKGAEAGRVPRERKDR
ncbi:MAG TPA: helix-turn-helix domain-containing protein [Thermoleophilaceae bacterium]|nr:helix-turn-helix domain-containing protein [Thermoleophilaceae bacterium]